MKLTIVGAGAIGGTVGAHMLRAGHEVLFCDVDADHVAAINEHGLHIEGPVDDFVVEARAVLPDELPETLGPTAIAVKTHHTEAAVSVLRDRLAPDAYVLSLQNGLTFSRLAAVVGEDRVVSGFVNFGADVLGPGRIVQGNVGTVRIGEPTGGEITARVKELADAVPYAVATGNVLGYLWGKEAYGAMLWAGAVSDLSIAEHLESPRWRPLVLAVAREVLAQAPVRPEAFDGFEPDDLEGSIERLVAFNRGSAKSHSGIYRDLTVRRRKTEVDDLLADLAGPLTTRTGRLIQAIERGERTCEVANLELLAAYERAERIGRPLRAVVRILDAPARRPEGPLHGLPVAVKDLIAVAGVPTGNGNPHDLAGPPAAADAPVVARLRELGAEVFATSGLLEYAAGATHPEVPETRNPFDPGRTAGGSSGGSAALVGAGVCPVALGTDTGGSIRIPAAYCGAVGLKPSFGAIDAGGVTPLAPSLDHVGLLGADVAVTARVFAALVGAGQVPVALPVGPTRLRIGLLSDQLAHRAVRPDVARVLAAAVERLSGDHEVLGVDGAAFGEILAAMDGILLWEAWQVHGERVTGDPDHYGPETLRLLRAAGRVSRERYDAARARRRELSAATEAAYLGVDVLLSPTVRFVAPATTPPVDTPEGAEEGLFTAPYNLTGAPALSLPCGWTEEGLPVGLQLSAPVGRDLELLAAAAAVEATLAVDRRVPLA